MTTETVTQKLQQGLRHHEAGELQQAEACYQAVLAVQQEHPEALFLLGGLVHQQGRSEEAVALLNRALQQAPGNTACLFALGNALRALDRLDEAVAAFHQVIARRPEEPNAWCNLGEALRAKGDSAGAIAAYVRALEIHGDFAPALQNLANIRLAEGDNAAAEALYRQLLRFHPHLVGAWVNLANACRLQGRWDEAAEACRQALSLQPELTDVWLLLGDLYDQLERLDEAARAFRKALALEEQRGDVWIRLGQVEDLRGRADEALAAYQQAIRLQPGYAEAHYFLGNSLSGSGCFDEAVAAFHQALRCNPSLTAAYYSLSQLRNYRFSEQDARQMKALGQQEDLSEEQQLFLDFALSRLAEQQRCHDEAFRYLAAANRLARKQCHYDVARTEAFFQDTQSVFSREFFARRAEFGLLDRTPIFIVGMMRSGSSLVEQILASHPDVHGAGELTDLKQIIYYFDGALNLQAYPAQVPGLNAEQVAARAQEYLRRLRERGGEALRVTDKMPGNFRYLGMIRLLFPRAKIIHCRRHPLDICLSCYRLYFSGAHPYAYDLRELGHYYRLYEGLMQHWHNVLLPGAIHDVQYESLVTDQEAETRRLLAFCDLPWHPACLDFHKSERAVLTASLSQVREPIYRSSLQKWQAYERYLGPLIEALDGNPGSGV